MDFDGSIEVPAGQDLQEWTLSLPARAGVYFLWGEGKEPILLATSGSVRAVVRRKLAGGSEQTAGRRAELDKITKGVSWTEANSNFVAYLQFHRLAREIDRTSLTPLTYPFTVPLSCSCILTSSGLIFNKLLFKSLQFALSFG